MVEEMILRALSFSEHCTLKNIVVDDLMEMKKCFDAAIENFDSATEEQINENEHYQYFCAWCDKYLTQEFCNNVLNKQIEEEKAINLKDTAKEIVEVLKNSQFNNITDSSGYYIVKENEVKDIARCVDVSKRQEDGKEFYVIYVSYEDEQSEWENTEDLSYESLLDKLTEIAESDWQL